MNNSTWRTPGTRVHTAAQIPLGCIVLGILSLSGDLPEMSCFPAGAALSSLGNLRSEAHTVPWPWKPLAHGDAHGPGRMWGLLPGWPIEEAA